MKHLVKTALAATATVLLGLLAINPSVNAQSGVTWTAEFFDNPYLVGATQYRTTTNEVAFNWGDGSPSSSVPSNNFSARIATDAYFTPGTYRFYMLADDGATVHLDFRHRLIDTYSDPRPGETLSGDFTFENAGIRHIQIDYRENDLDAYIYFTWERLDDGAQGPNFPDPTPDDAANTNPIANIYWTSQYYNNTSLSGSPAAIIGGTGLNFNWGSGSPVPSVQSDNFSARWNGIYNLDGGPYLISVEADDGVRVYMDGVRIIDEWHEASGEVYTKRIQPAAGNHTFTVEFYEAQGLAFINFQLGDIIEGGQTVNTPYNASATVTTYRLNVRDLPNPTTGNIIDRISRGETYGIVGRRADNSWVQINVAGRNGWVNASYVSTTNLQNVPVTYSAAPQQPTPSNATATVTAFRLNVRDLPDPARGNVIDRISWGETYSIVGRRGNNSWVQISVDGRQGWVNASYVDTTNLQTVPVTYSENTNQPQDTGYDARTRTEVNLRTGPGINNQRILIIPQFTAVDVLGRNLRATWWQVRYNNTVGWASAEYAVIEDDANLSQIPITG